MTLAKLDLVPLLQGIEMPAYKRVIVGVDTCGDEGSPPINLWEHTNNELAPIADGKQ